MTNRENLFIPGGLLTGMGIGLILDEVAGGMFLGLGAGLILSTLFSYFGNKGAADSDLEKKNPRFGGKNERLMEVKS